MAPQHEDRERHGSHLPTEWTEPRERPRFESEDTAERLEMDRHSTSGAVTWQMVEKAIYVAGGILGCVLTGATTYYGVVGTVQDSRKDIEALTARVVVIEKGRSETLPRFEEQVRLNAQQDVRLQNAIEANGRTATAVNDLARVIGTLSDRVSEVRERQGILEGRIGNGLPHDR